MGFGGMGGGAGGTQYEIVEDDLTTWGREIFGDPARCITFSAGMSPVCANDAAPQTLYYPKSLYIPAGVTLSPSNRCKGLWIFVNGHLLVEGTISMSVLGSTASGVATDLPAVIKKIRRHTRAIGATTIVTDELIESMFGTVGTVPAAGGAGGAGVSLQTAGTAGTAGTARKTGGGGSGGGSYTKPSTTAGTGTSYVGGSGSVSGSGVAAGSGGGVIFIVVRGNIYVASTGVISANGSAGTAGSGTVGGGGGGGGGSINIVYGGTYTNSGTVQANGGAGGASDYTGGAGGAGCITVEQLAAMLS